MKLVSRIIFIACILASAWCFGGTTPSAPFTKRTFIEAINPNDPVSLKNAINDSKFFGFDDEVQFILLDIWRGDGRIASEVKGMNISDPVLRASAAGAIFQALSRNPSSDPGLLDESRDFLRKAVDDPDPNVGIQALSDLSGSHDPQDVSKFFEVAKKEDERFKMAAIAVSSNCSPTAIRLADELQKQLSGEKREFVLGCIERRKEGCGR